MPHLVSVLPLDDFRLSVRFDDGIQGVAELRTDYLARSSNLWAIQPCFGRSLSMRL